MTETKGDSSNLKMRLSLMLSCSSIVISTIVLYSHLDIDRRIVKYWNDFFYPLPTIEAYIEGCMERARVDLGNDFNFLERKVSNERCMFVIERKGSTKVLYEYKYDRKENRWL